VNSLNPGRLAVALTLFAALAAHAQSTNGAETNPPPARIESAPVKLDESSFRIVSERNIYNANRSGGTVRSASSRRPARVETFALVGTMAYEKGAFAFFEGSSSEFTKALKPDGVIAGYKLVDILANGVKLEMDGQVMELAIGSGLRREDQGAWKVSEMAAVETGSTGSGGSSESANRYSRNGRSRRGGDSSSERSTESGSSSPASSSTASNADQSEILKRLMERREKEK
jgi:hypothetical protein